MKGEKYLLKGQIHVDPNSLGGSENLPQNIQVDILDTENSVVGGITASPVHSEFDQSATAVYEYSTWATPGDKFIFVPRDSRYVIIVVDCGGDEFESSLFHCYYYVPFTLPSISFGCFPVCLRLR